MTMPLRATGFQLDVKAENRPVAPGEAMPRAEYRTASPEYFTAAGIPLKKGRYFTTMDRDSAARVVIINETLARRLFGTDDPINRRVNSASGLAITSAWMNLLGMRSRICDETDSDHDPCDRGEERTGLL